MSLNLEKFGFSPSSGGGGVSPSGIAYRQSVPVIFLDSQQDGDTPYFWAQGAYERTNPAYPAVYAEVDYQAQQSAVRATPATGTLSTDPISPTILTENNAFGNKLRFTDSLGNASDATVGSNIWAHVDWRSHSFTGAVDNYVIDHLNGWGYDLDHLQDGSIVSMNSDSTGQSWNDWMTTILNLGTHKTYTGWIPLDLNDGWALGQAMNSTSLWCSKFATFDAAQSGATRGSLITGESYSSGNFQIFYDTANNIEVQVQSTSVSSAFAFRIANCFVKRKHY